MKQQPDKFFQEKLKDYTRTPPTAAWDRIEASLEKKTTPIIEWWKIAAALLLLTSIAYFLWNNTEFNDTQPLAKSVLTQDELNESAKQPENTSPVIKKETSKERGQNKASDIVPVEIVGKNKTKSIHVEQKRSAALVVKKKKSPPIVKELVPPIEDKTLTLENIVTTLNANTHAVAVSMPSSRRLTFSVEETNQYLDKKAIAQATSDEKKSSTFKKLLQKAGDLKTNQDPFGDLREKKNEILALNFKNEKRGQNK